MDTSLPQEVLAKIRGLLGVAGHPPKELYIVGGFVRDLLHNVPSRDIDVAVFQDSNCPREVFQIATQLSAVCSSLGIPTEVYEAYPSTTPEHDDFSKTWLLCMKLYLDVGQVDLLFSKAPSIKECLATFDFNINQVCLDEAGDIEEHWEYYPECGLRVVTPVSDERTGYMYKKWLLFYGE